MIWIRLLIQIRIFIMPHFPSNKFKSSLFLHLKLFWTFFLLSENLLKNITFDDVCILICKLKGKFNIWIPSGSVTLQKNSCEGKWGLARFFYSCPMKIFNDDISLGLLWMFYMPLSACYISSPRIVYKSEGGFSSIPGQKRGSSFSSIFIQFTALTCRQIDF